MQEFTNGKYLGRNILEYRFNGLIVSQNQYQTGFSSSWHYHENAYFAFILKGGSLEKRKKEDIECIPGLLLYYNTQEPHKNEQYKAGSKNFSVEFENGWFKNMCVEKSRFEGGLLIRNPVLKTLFLKILAETRDPDKDMQISIETMVLQSMAIISASNKEYATAPEWLLQLKDFLHDNLDQPYSLKQLSGLFGMHPVTISKLFPHFFHCTLGEYIRKIKMDKAYQFLARKHISLQTISELCGFADHPHFTRVFKRHSNLTPSQYRDILLR